MRDPIDHFLSGWAECGVRQKILNENITASYDERVFAWLKIVRDHQYSKKRYKKKWYKCENHSFPQANYLLQRKERRTKNNKAFSYFHPKLDIIGDMRELPELLEMVGFAYNKTLGSVVPNQMKYKYPRDKSRLSNRTIDALCEYLALDYYLFDFEPPLRCRDQIGFELASIIMSKS